MTEISIEVTSSRNVYPQLFIPLSSSSTASPIQSYITNIPSFLPSSRSTPNAPGPGRPALPRNPGHMYARKGQLASLRLESLVILSSDYFLAASLIGGLRNLHEVNNEIPTKERQLKGKGELCVDGHLALIFRCFESIL